jgi:hypothetical protein
MDVLLPADNFSLTSATNISNNDNVSETNEDGSFKFDVVGKYIRIETADGFQFPPDCKVLIMLSKIG